MSRRMKLFLVLVWGTYFILPNAMGLFTGRPESTLLRDRLLFALAIFGYFMIGALGAALNVHWFNQVRRDNKPIDPIGVLSMLTVIAVFFAARVFYS